MDAVNRLADPDDLRFLVLFAAILIPALLLAVAVGAQPFMRRADPGFGFRWVKRR